MSAESRKNISEIAASCGALSTLVRNYLVWEECCNEQDVFAGDYAHSAFVSELARLAIEHRAAPVTEGTEA